MPSGSMTKPETFLFIGMKTLECAMVAHGACALKITCAFS